MPGFISLGIDKLVNDPAVMVYVLTARFNRFERDSTVFLLGVFTTEESAIICRDGCILNGVLNGYCEDSLNGNARECDFDINYVSLNNYWKVEL